VIVPVALVVGLLQLLIPADGNRGGWLEKRPMDDTAPTVPGTRGAPQAQRLPESTGRAEPRRPPLPTSEPPASGAGAADEAAAAAPAQVRVFIHHTAGAENALPAIQLAAYLQTRGFAVTDIRQVEVRIDQPSVRYFSDGDRPESRRLVDAIGAFFAKAPGRGPDQAADFSRFSPKPPEGSVEVWLPAPGPRERPSA
jgi:hypothetical protein